MNDEPFVQDVIPLPQTFQAEMGPHADSIGELRSLTVPELVAFLIEFIAERLQQATTVPHVRTEKRATLTEQPPWWSTEWSTASSSGSDRRSAVQAKLEGTELLQSLRLLAGRLPSLPERDAWVKCGQVRDVAVRRRPMWWVRWPWRWVRWP